MCAISRFESILDGMGQVAVSKLEAQVFWSNGPSSWLVIETGCMWYDGTKCLAFLAAILARQLAINLVRLEFVRRRVNIRSSSVLINLITINNFLYSAIVSAVAWPLKSSRSGLASIRWTLSWRLCCRREADYLSRCIHWRSSLTTWHHNGFSRWRLTWNSQ